MSASTASVSPATGRRGAPRVTVTTRAGTFPVVSEPRRFNALSRRRYIARYVAAALREWRTEPTVTDIDRAKELAALDYELIRLSRVPPLERSDAETSRWHELVLLKERIRVRFDHGAKAKPAKPDASAFYAHTGIRPPPGLLP